MARERTRLYLAQAKARERSNAGELTAAVDGFLPALTGLLEQAVIDEGGLHLAEQSDSDAALRDLFEQASQKLGAIRREHAEITKRLRRVMQARREYDEVLEQIEKVSG